MSERATGWVINDPDTGLPRNPDNVVASDKGPTNAFNMASFGGPATAVAEAPAPAAPKRSKAPKGQPTELDMGDEAAVLDAIARLGLAESQDPAYAKALDDIAAAERAFNRPAVRTALAGVGR